MKKIILPLNKRLTKSRSRNRILLGLTALGLTIGALGFATNSQSSVQKIARQSSSFSRTRNSQLNNENLRLKTTYLWCPNYELNVFDLFTIPKCNWMGLEEKPKTSETTNNQNEEDKGKLKTLEKDVEDLKEEVASQRKVLEEHDSSIQAIIGIIDEDSIILEQQRQILEEQRQIIKEQKQTIEILKKKYSGKRRT